MKTSFYLILVCVALTACRSYEFGQEMPRTVNREYTVLGTVRMEEKLGNVNATYDGLLTKARSEFGAKADIVGLKVDKYRKGRTWYYIFNAYAVEYK